MRFSLLSPPPERLPIYAFRFRVTRTSSHTPLGGSDIRTLFLSTDYMHAPHLANLPREYNDEASALPYARDFLEDQCLRLEANPSVPHVERSDFAPIYHLQSHFAVAHDTIYKGKTIHLILHDDYPRLPSEDVPQFVDDISDVAMLTCSVLGQEA